MYNFKFVEYPSGVRRVVFYEYLVRENFVQDDRAVTGPDWFPNPFDGALCREDPSLFPNLYDDDERLAATMRRDRTLYESMRRTKGKIYDYGLCNRWDWFVTLTFDPLLIDRYSYGDCVDAMWTFLRRCRRRCPGFTYLFVPELHKDGAWHFHGLLSGCDGLGFVDSGHTSHGQPVYNLDVFRYGFSTATRIADTYKSVTYITKYITKELCGVSQGRRRYWASRNLVLPDKRTLCLELHSNRDLFLDTLSYVARYYKRSVSIDGECVTHFFEFGPDDDIAFDDFIRFT